MLTLNHAWSLGIVWFFAAATTTKASLGMQAWTPTAHLDHIRFDGSSAINAGANIPSVTTDFEGAARPKGGTHDIGAFEQ